MKRMHGIRNSKSKLAEVIDTMADKAERRAAKHRFGNHDRRAARAEMNKLRGTSTAQLSEHGI